MNAIIVTQARYGSSRFSGKVLQDLGGKSMLEVHLERLKKSKKAKQVMLATTEEAEADQIVAIGKKLGCLTFRGSLLDVLDRFYQAVKNLSFETIVRVTSDCPFNDASLIDLMLEQFENSKFDYLSNVHPPTYPDGVDIEIFKFAALKRSWLEGHHIKDREHVTHYIYTNPDKFNLGNFENERDESLFRLTVDKPEDLTLVNKLVAKLGDQKPWFEYVKYLREHPELNQINDKNTRNEGF